MSSDVAEGEVLPAVSAPAPVTLFHTDDPAEVVRRATDIAQGLAAIVRDRRLAQNIQGREYVRVEAWTMLGSMLGVFPVCTWTRPVEGGWEARVEARTLAGALVGAAEAQVTRQETNWRSRDDYALRSMAQTRATGKAMRLPLGFVMSLAGYEATPAEEMPPAGVNAETGEIVPDDASDYELADEDIPFESTAPPPPSLGGEARAAVLRAAMASARQKGVRNIDGQTLVAAALSKSSDAGSVFYGFDGASLEDFTEAQTRKVLDWIQQKVDQRYETLHRRETPGAGESP